MKEQSQPKEEKKEEVKLKKDVKSPGFQAKDLNIKTKNLDELELKQLANIKQLI